MAIKLSIINAKGGTAKTTTAVNLAHALANKNIKVLVCDLDPQASASLSFGFKRDVLYPSIADVLIEGFPVNKAIRATSVGGVGLLTGSMALSSFDITFANSKGREHKLKNTLDQIKGYDVIIMDCPPTLGLLSLNAITAADQFIVPVVPQYLALEGLATLTEALDQIKAGIGCKAEMMGIVLTQVDRRGKAAGEIISLIRKHYGDKVFKTEIKVNTRLSEAPSFGLTIFQHDWAATGASAYQALGNEVIARLMKETKNVEKESRITRGATSC